MNVKGCVIILLCGFLCNHRVSFSQDIEKKISIQLPVTPKTDASLQKLPDLFFLDNDSLAINHSLSIPWEDFIQQPSLNLMYPQNLLPNHSSEFMKKVLLRAILLRPLPNGMDEEIRRAFRNADVYRVYYFKEEEYDPTSVFLPRMSPGAGVGLSFGGMNLDIVDFLRRRKLQIRAIRTKKIIDQLNSLEPIK